MADASLAAIVTSLHGRSGKTPSSEMQMPSDYARLSSLAVAEDVATIDDYVANVNADAALNPTLVRYVGVTLSHTALDIERTTHRVNNTGELSQQAVAGVLDNPPPVLSNLGLNEEAQVVPEPGVRSLPPHPARSGGFHECHVRRCPRGQAGHRTCTQTETRWKDRSDPTAQKRRTPVNLWQVSTCKCRVVWPCTTAAAKSRSSIAF
jgi:hypothetical protein